WTDGERRRNAGRELRLECGNAGSLGRGEGLREGGLGLGAEPDLRLDLRVVAREALGRLHPGMGESLAARGGGKTDEVAAAQCEVGPEDEIDPRFGVAARLRVRVLRHGC